MVKDTEGASDVIRATWRALLALSLVLAAASVPALYTIFPTLSSTHGFWKDTRPYLFLAWLVILGFLAWKVYIEAEVASNADSERIRNTAALSSESLNRMSAFEDTIDQAITALATLSTEREWLEYQDSIARVVDEYAYRYVREVPQLGPGFRVAVLVADGKACQAFAPFHLATEWKNLTTASRNGAASRLGVGEVISRGEPQIALLRADDHETLPSFFNGSEAAFVYPVKTLDGCQGVVVAVGPLPPVLRLELESGRGSPRPLMEGIYDRLELVTRQLRPLILNCARFLAARNDTRLASGGAPSGTES